MAARLGRTVGELECTISSSEFTEWLAFDALEPAPFVDDYRVLLLAATILNQTRKPDVDPIAPFDLFELLPWRADFAKQKTQARRPQQTPEEQAAILNFAARAAGKTVKRID